MSIKKITYLKKDVRKELYSIKGKKTKLHALLNLVEFSVLTQKEFVFSNSHLKLTWPAGKTTMAFKVRECSAHTPPRLNVLSFNYFQKGLSILFFFS